MKKRVISLVLSLAMCLSTCATVFADPTVLSTDEKRAYLASTCSIPTEFLNSATDDIISEIYEETTTNCVTVSSYVEERDNMGQPNPSISPMSISPNDFKMSTLVMKVMDRSGTTFLYYDVYTDYEWLNKAPFWRLGKDGITVNWDNSLLYYVADSFYGRLYYKTQTSNGWIRYDYLQNPDKAEQGGVGVTFDLHNDCETYLKGTIRFRLDTDYFGSGRTTTINSNYAHTYMPASSLSICVSGLNVTFSSTSGRDLCASSANVTLA